jgi:hypothetical protein
MMKAARHLDFLSLAVTLVPILPLAWDTWGVHYYRQGLRNEPMNLAPGVMTVAIVASFAIAILLVRTWHLRTIGDSREMLCWFMFVLALMVWPTVLIFNTRPIEVYARGLEKWARREVNADAIRAGGDVQSLHADRVERSPNGILLQWGRYQILPGKLRKVFIGTTAASSPPDEGRDFWREAQPGVYVGVHGRR